MWERVLAVSLTENRAIREDRSQQLLGHNFLVPTRSTPHAQISADGLNTAPPQQDVLPQVVEILEVLGCSQHIMDPVKSKVEEKTKTQHEVPGEKERMLHVLKMKLAKAKSRLVHLQVIEKKKEED